MKHVFFFLSSIPAIVLVAVLCCNGDFNRGGPQVAFGLLMIAVLAVLSPLITLFEIVLLMVGGEQREGKTSMIIAVLAAALPGIILVILIHNAHG